MENTRITSAKEFLETFKNESDMTFLIESIREGYVGRKVNNFTQTLPGPIVGYFAAVYDKNTNKLCIGMSIINKGERCVSKYIGQMIALKRAIDGFNKGFAENRPATNKYKKKLDRFVNRCHKYFKTGL